MAERKGPNPEHLAKLKEGVGVWNRWREENRGIHPGLEFADLKQTDLVGANLRRTSLRGASLRGINLTGADLRNAKLRGADLYRANLNSTNLAAASLSYALLQSADLRNAYLVRAKLRNADLKEAYLSGANLSGANLDGAILSRASLRDVCLSRSNLSDASLTSTDLRRANLSGADLSNTHLHQVDLREVKGLEEVKHLGPSPISTQTLERSRGQIPEVFLKGCGLKDWEILGARLHDPNLRQDEVIDISYKIAEIRGSSPIVPLSVFLSYSRRDSPFVDKVAKRLDGDGIRSWRDTHDLTAGPWEEQIDRAVGLQNAVVLVLSKESIGSKWVKAEVERAQEVREGLEEKSGEPVHMLCPVALDDSWQTDKSWPRVIRMEVQRYNILDFSWWEDDEAFESEYQKLKTGLGIYYRSEREG